MNDCGIYALEDPRQPGVVRYVGGSTQLSKRRGQYATRCDDGNFSKKMKWIASLRAEGVRPVFRVLQTCAPDQLADLERRTIEGYVLIGEADLNTMHTKRHTRKPNTTDRLRARIKYLEDLARSLGATPDQIGTTPNFWVKGATNCNVASTLHPQHCNECNNTL